LVLLPSPGSLQTGTWEIPMATECHFFIEKLMPTPNICRHILPSYHSFRGDFLRHAIPPPPLRRSLGRALSHTLPISSRTAPVFLSRRPLHAMQSTPTRFLSVSFPSIAVDSMELFGFLVGLFVSERPHFSYDLIFFHRWLPVAFPLKLDSHPPHLNHHQPTPASVGRIGPRLAPSAFSREQLATCHKKCNFTQNKLVCGTPWSSCLELLQKKAKS